MIKKIAILLLVVVHARLAAQTTAEKADALMNAYAQQYKFTGSVLVAQKGKEMRPRSYYFTIFVP